MWYRRATANHRDFFRTPALGGTTTAATREVWHLAEAIERQAVTDGTRRRLAIATAGNQKLAFRKAAGRGIGDETRLRITLLDPLGALGNFDDPGADRLSAACRQRHAPRA